MSHLDSLLQVIVLPFKQFQKCRDPGSNRGPSDLQSDALPTELSRQMVEAFHIMPGELPEMLWMGQNRTTFTLSRTTFTHSLISPLHGEGQDMQSTMALHSSPQPTYTHHDDSHKIFELHCVDQRGLSSWAMIKYSRRDSNPQSPP